MNFNIGNQIREKCTFIVIECIITNYFKKERKSINSCIKNHPITSIILYIIDKLHTESIQSIMLDY